VRLNLFLKHALAEWVRAVNGHGGFGVWKADVSRHPKDIHEILAKHNSDGEKN
jgi:type III restriction enzyme